MKDESALSTLFDPSEGGLFEIVELNGERYRQCYLLIEIDGTEHRLSAGEAHAVSNLLAKQETRFLDLPDGDLVAVGQIKRVEKLRQDLP